MGEKIGIVGLGYVGLPLALAFARKFSGTIGFDIHAEKVAELRKNVDITGEVTPQTLRESSIQFTTETALLESCTFFTVAVPTPINAQNRPDLEPLIKASETVGKALKPGAVVVYESTVYPGVTEDICGPILERASGLKRGVDFKLGYSPERINPGDKEHTLERITKIVAGEDSETLFRIERVYGAIVPAGIHRAPSIKVAEAAKVIENTQRDLNIALMNELAMIFDRMDIKTRDVLAAANTKWNFMPFRPGLVGGHCIGVDPYYLTSKAEELGYRPEVILAGRRINDGMGVFVAQKTIKLLAQARLPTQGARIGILGLTFKENLADLRNSRIPSIVSELESFGIEPLVSDALAEPKDALREYNIKLCSLEMFKDLDAVILAVAHKAYVSMPVPELVRMLKPKGVFVDVKSAVDPANLPHGVTYWSL